MVDASFVNELINRMVEKDAYEGIFVAGAKPLIRTDSGVVKFKDTPLSSEDVIQLLVLLRQKSKLANSPLDEAGNFSFGIKRMGRFSVEYLQQRGSIVVFLRRMRDRVPDIREIIQSREFLPIFVHLLGKKGLFIVTGRKQTLNTTMAASILAYLSSKQSGIIYTLEKPQTHLLKHNRAVFIQREVGTDVSSFHEGITHALGINVDILYLNDVPDELTLNGILRAIERGITVILSFSSASIPHALMYLENTSMNSINVRELLSASLQCVINPLELDKAGIKFNWLMRKDEVANLIRLGNYFELEQFIKSS